MNLPAASLSTADLAAENTASLDAIVANSHPLMVEAFYLAAIPRWYDHSFLKMARQKDDGREEGLITRLSRYSFVSASQQYDEAEPVYYVRAEERDFLQKRWIAEDPQAYRLAHQRALAFWEAQPDPNPFAQAQNRLYHQFFVDYDASIRDLIALFRTYTNERHLAAVERLLSAAEEAHTYLALLDAELTPGFDSLILYLKARLAQLRGHWEHSLELLKSIEPNAAPDLSSYIARAYGFAFAEEGNYVEAIQKFTEALALFDRQGETFTDSQNLQNDRAYTLMALGDAHVDLAITVRGRVEQRRPRSSFQQHLRDFFTFFAALPLVLYLTPSLGWRVWHPRFWPVLRDLDWIIARLFVTGAKYYDKADRLLEQYGTPAESVVADEKLANLYLALGDTQQAELRFLRLWTESETPLSSYHQAAVCVGVGETYLRLYRPRQALKPLRAALPVLATYEDRELEARARDLLGRALLSTEEPAEAISHLIAAQEWYQAQEKWTEATRLVEYVEVWEQSREVTDPVQTQIKALTDGLQKRQYMGIFQHRLPVYFRRLVLMALPVILLIAQLLAVTVETGSGLAPDIRFRPAPLLDPNQEVILNLDLGVTTAHVTVLDDTNVVVVWAIALLFGYVLISLLSGLAIIRFTQLRTVQARGREATVCFDNHAVTVGKDDTAQTLRWADISRFIKADVRLWLRPLRNGSGFGLGAAQEQIAVGGNISRYAHVREQVEQRVTPATRIVNLDYAILRSKMGILFVLNLLAIGLFNLLAKVAPAVLFDRLLGTIYSLADLYPYLFLGIVIASLWWGIIQPLRQRVHLWPRSPLALWMLGLGLLLTFIQITLRFRPLLTVLDLYPPFITAVILVSAGIAIWRAQASGRKIYPIYARVAVAVVVLVASSLMVTVLWRDVGAYHQLVTGHALRDRALQDNEPIRAKLSMEKALAAYGHAAALGSREVWGIDTRPAAHIALGIPAPDNFIWLAALINQSALQVQLSRYEQAIQNYTQALTYLDSPDQIYAWRALAMQGATTALTQQSQYEKAIADLDEAIRLNPNNAAYYFWRGATQQASGRFDEALISYDNAIKLDAEQNVVHLTDDQRARIFAGQGWIDYMRKEYRSALDFFEQAKATNPKSAAAWMGEGYTLYALGLYEDVLPVWEKAVELDPKDATILISLGTLHWKLGGQSEEFNLDRCEEYRQSVDYFTRATDRERLYPHRDQDAAFTYRTRGQLQYLLQQARCPGYDRVETLKQAVASYTEAIHLDPGNANYWHMRGRLSYAVWLRLQEQGEATYSTTVEWLLNGLDDTEKAIELAPNIASYYTWQQTFMLPLFQASLSALQEGDVARAVDFYGKGLVPDTGTTDIAVKRALIAVVDDDIPEAAYWLNEATRRVLTDTNKYYHPWFRASGEHLRALWAIKGVTGDTLLAEMESQSPRQLATYPELKDNGLYWRYRAWFKYHVGLSAFRLSAETTAKAFLQSAKEDAQRATEISTDHLSVSTYLVESAWGFYHIARGDDAVVQGSLQSAFMDYVTAFETITPKDNATAPAEKTQAAFSAGLTALKLKQSDRATQWYDRGIALAKAYENNNEVQDMLKLAIQELQAWLNIDPGSATTAKPILDQLQDLQ